MAVLNILIDEVYNRLRSCRITTDYINRIKSACHLRKMLLI